MNVTQNISLYVMATNERIIQFIFTKHISPYLKHFTEQM
jgi:hypothetical protein